MLDPFRAVGCWRRHQQVEDRDRLLDAVTSTDRDDLVAHREVHAGDGDGHPEHGGVERKHEVLLDHREQAGDLLLLVVAVDGGLLDQHVKLSPGDRRSQ